MKLKKQINRRKRNWKKEKKMEEMG